MNKLTLIIFPIAVMIMLAIINILTAGGNYVGNVDINSPDGSVTVDGVTSTATYDVTQTQFLGIFSKEDIYIMFALTIGVAIAIGFTALGIGITTLSQELFLKGTVFGGIWGLLSISSWEFFNSDALAGIGVFIWSILTISYIIGFIFSVGGD